MAADLKILITAQNLARAALRQVEQDLGRVNQQAGFASRGMQGLQGVVGGGLKLAVGAGTAVLGGLTAGMGALVGSGVALNSSLENVEAQLLAFTKDGDVAKGILEQIRTEAATTPFAFEEMARATASLLPAAKQSGAELMDLVRTAEILAASNPAEGLEGAAFAIREALSGDFVSIVERFNLPRQRLNELKEQGVPAMEAISIAMKEMGLDADLVTNLAGTMSGRWSTFMDTIDTLKGTLAKPMFNLLSSGLVRVQKLLDANMPALTEFAEAVGTKLADAVETATVFVTSFIDVLGNSDSVIVALKWALIDAFGEDTPWVEGIFRASKMMRGFVAQISQIAAPVVRLVREFFSWKDVLGAVAIVIASMVLPALWGMVAAATPVIAMFAALVAGVSLLRNAWERDWGGIQEKVQSAWAVIQTVFEGLRTALSSGDFGPLLETLGGLWSQLQSWMGTIATGIRENAATWLTAMSDWAVGLWGTVSPWLTEMAGKVANWVILQSIVLRTQAATWATALADWAVGVWDQLQVNLVTLANQLVNWVLLQGLVLRTQLYTWQTSFIAWGQDIWDGLLPNLTTLIEYITSWIGAQQDVLYAQLSAWSLEFSSWVGDAWAELMPELDTFAGQIGNWILLQGLVLATRFSTWLNGIDGFTEGLTSVVETTKSVWDQLAPIIDNHIQRFREAFQSFSDDLGPLGEAFQQLWQQIGPVLTMIGLAIAFTFNAALIVIASVIGQIAALFTALINALTSLVEGMKNIFGGLFTMLASLFKGDWNGIWIGALQVFVGFVQVVIGFWNLFVSVVVSILTILKDTVVGIFNDMGIDLVAKFEAIRMDAAVDFERISGAITRAMDNAKTSVVATWEAAKQPLVSAWNAIKSSGEGAFGAIKTAMDAIVAAKTSIETSLGGLSKFFSELSIPNPFGGITTALGGIIDLANRAKDALSKLGGGGGGGTGAGNRNAAGTAFFAGGMTLVGERGPEMVYLPRGSRIENAEATAAMGGGDVYVTVNANVASSVDVETLAWQIAQKVAERRRR